MLSLVKKTVVKHDMLSRGDRVVVAVSGGPDSVCLLSVLRELAPELSLTLHIAHLDHMFRGEESAAEARFVRDLAEAAHLPATIDAFDVPRYCRERGLSSQAGAREVRYRFLGQAAASVKASRIALGHTASDQAETLLLRLLRGAGAAGLSGMRPKRGMIIRPLIAATRKAVLEHLAQRGLPFTTDPSNLSAAYTRNRVRLELLPALRTFNPRIEELLAAEATLLQDEDDAMDRTVEGLLPGTVLQSGGSVSILREPFRALLPALQRRLLRTTLLLALGDDAPALSWTQTEEALAFIADAGSGRSLHLPGGAALTREYGQLIVDRGAHQKSFSCPLPVPGSTKDPDARWEFAATVDRAPAPAQGNSRWQATFDYDKIGAPLFIRTRRNGDRFCPAGMGGKSKKLQDFLSDEKVPRRVRDAVPLLATERNILWVVGMRTDERFLAGPGTKRHLVVTVKREG